MTGTQKVTVAVIAAVAFMISLVVISNTNFGNKGGSTSGQNPSAGSVSIEYSRLRLIQSGNGNFTAASSEILTVNNSGSSSYVRNEGSNPSGSMEKKFNLDSEKLRTLNALVLETGFMDATFSEYQAREGITNFTSYVVKVKVGDSFQSVKWVDPGAYAGNIPPIISRIGTELDSLIDENAN